MLLWWWVRLHNLLQLPAFIDEGAHLQWARLVWRMQPFHGASDGKLLGIWLGAAFWPFAGGLWLLRVAGLLVGVCGFAALLATARRWKAARSAITGEKELASYHRRATARCRVTRPPARPRAAAGASC